MATVHPSRTGMVPGARVSRPPPPPPSREDELRRKLMERRKDKNGDQVEERIVDASDGSGRHRSSWEMGDGYERRRDARSADRARSRERERDERRHEGGRAKRDRSPSPYSRRERRHDNGRDERDHVSSPRDRDDRRARDPPAHREDRRDRELPPHRDDQREPDRSRRPSPSYRAYDGPPPPREEPFIPLNGGAPDGKYGYGREMAEINGSGAPPPWRGAVGGGPVRMGFDRGPGGGGWLNPVDMERRRLERESMTLTVWPPSPKEPYRDEDEIEADRKARRKAKKSKSSKKSKRKSKYSSSSSSVTDSEDERRRRRRRKEKERERRRKLSDDESDEEPRKRRKEARSETKLEKDEGDAADQWIEKGGEVVVRPKEVEEVAPLQVPEYEDDDDVEVGPQLPVEHVSKAERYDRATYANMLKGEAEAMAAFAASGQRIPRRGEIGLESSTIEAFESSGYVMSGSRHRRMNAVRMRKENQVINAEEKRAILKLQREEKDKKEGMIIGQFREMMDDNLRKQGIEKP